MYRLLLAGVLLFPMPLFAYLVTITDQSQPYEVVPVEGTIGEEQYFLGTLADYPIMYEVTADEPFTIAAQVRQLANRELEPFGLLIIRQNDRGGGVSEVTRMNVTPDEWTVMRDRDLGLRFRESPQISEAVGPGTYRIEVSTPANRGQYLLRVGNTPATTGYWTKLSSVRDMQAYFGYSGLAMLGSQLVYYPLGILLLCFFLYKIWQYRSVFKLSPDHGTT